MDPVTLILTALTAGAALGLRDTSTSTVQDTYEILKTLARRRLADRPDGELMLARYEQAPETWEALLAAELTAAGAEYDVELLKAAQALMSVADETGTRVGKYNLNVRGSHGVVVGDQNSQNNLFGPGLGLSGDDSGD